jgi:peptidoglycan/LPS O-acetylase OafA/YrhL
MDKSLKKYENRSLLLDFLKGIAIVAVILYHSGLFTYGYLGVEIFLVVGGYLTTRAFFILMIEVISAIGTSL